MFDVLAKARTSPLLAQQLDWPKRVSMALDAAKVSISLQILLHSLIGLVCWHHETAFTHILCATKQCTRAKDCAEYCELHQRHKTLLQHICQV